MKVTDVRARTPACVQGILPLPVARCLGHESGVPGVLRILLRCLGSCSSREVLKKLQEQKLLSLFSKQSSVTAMMEPASDRALYLCDSPKCLLAALQAYHGVRL